MSCCENAVCPMKAKYGIPDFNPLDAVEGFPKSPVWIVALNPKTEEEDHERGKSNPMQWNTTEPKARHFSRLKGILGPWYDQLFKKDGIAHTDIVKCGSPAFTSIEAEAVQHCKSYFIEQIKKHKPKLLLVLSSDAARIIAKEAELPDDVTEGTWKVGEQEDEFCFVILSGYSGPRQERYAKLRLKKDFLAAAAEYAGWTSCAP